MRKSVLSDTSYGLPESARISQTRIRTMFFAYSAHFVCANLKIDVIGLPFLVDAVILLSPKMNKQARR